MMLLFLAALVAQAPAATPSGWGAPAPASTKVWPTREGDVVLKDFRFRSGESLPELHIHYTTLGTPHRNAVGAIDNAVMVLHGTGGSGKQFLRPQFADELYGPGQPLDIRRYWIILPDNIGHGKSSKPSDGFKMNFPKYDYDDMVEAQHRVLTEALGVTHLRLVFGTSMGCMHAFMWGETWPNFASALMPMACEPIEIAGLNRMWRQLAINGIEADPAWKAGNYRTQPIDGLRTAQSLLFVAGSAPLNYQTAYPTNSSASVFAEERVRTAMLDLDANDLIYQLDSSRTYNPWPDLEKIKAPLTWVNSADDFINPPELGLMEQLMPRVKHGRYVLLPITDQTRGHGTHSLPAIWKSYLAEFLKELPTQ